MNAIYKKLFTFILPSCWLFNCVVTCGQRQCPVTTARSSPGWRIADNWGDRGLDWAARLEIEAWGRHIKGGNLFHLRIRLSWPGLDTAHCQGLISGAGKKVAVQSASNKRRSVLFLFQNSYNQQFLYISISKLHININSMRLDSSGDINNADSASEENVNKVETESQIPSILIFCLLLARAGNFVHSN